MHTKLKFATNISLDTLSDNILNKTPEDVMIIVPSSYAIYHIKHKLYKLGMRKLPFIVYANNILNYLPTLNQFLFLDDINLSNLVENNEIESILISHLRNDLDTMLYSRLKLLSLDPPLEVKGVLKQKGLLSTSDKLHEILIHSKNKPNKYIYYLEIKHSSKIEKMKKSIIYETSCKEIILTRKLLSENKEKYKKIVIVTDTLKREIKMSLSGIQVYASGTDKLHTKMRELLLLILSLLYNGSDEDMILDLELLANSNTEYSKKLRDYINVNKIYNLQDYILSIFKVLTILKTEIPFTLKRKLQFLSSSKHLSKINPHMAFIILKSLIHHIKVPFENGNKRDICICSIHEAIWCCDEDTLFIITQCSDNYYLKDNEEFKILLETKSNLIFCKEEQIGIHPILQLYVSSSLLELETKYYHTKIYDHFYPQKKPVVELSGESIPKKCSPSSIELLMKNPYLYYIKYILKLRPKQQYKKEASSQLFGILLHDFMSKLSKLTPNQDINSLYYSSLKTLPIEVSDLIKEEFHRRWKVLLPWLLKITRDFSHGAKKSFEEIKAVRKISGTEIFAIADRVLEYPSGEIIIIDYKTTTIPSLNKVKKYLAPQLPIEGLLFDKGSEITLYYVQCTNNPCLKKIYFDRLNTKKFIKLLSKTFFCGSMFSRKARFFATSETNNEYKFILREKEWNLVY